MADIVSWKDKAERASNALKRYKEESTRSAEKTLAAVETAGGGVLAAICDQKLQYIPGTQVETKTALGMLLSACSVMNPFLGIGDVADHLGNIGNGMNAVSAYEETKRLFAAAR